MVDTDLPPPEQAIPYNNNHLHFGAGQTETMLELPPGKHTLQLLMGDDRHIPPNSAGDVEKDHDHRGAALSRPAAGHWRSRATRKPLAR